VYHTAATTLGLERRLFDVGPRWLWWRQAVDFGSWRNLASRCRSRKQVNTSLSKYRVVPKVGIYTIINKSANKTRFLESSLNVKV